MDQPLRHLDRVEIYRALIADPKEVRKQRVADGKPGPFTRQLRDAFAAWERADEQRTPSAEGLDAGAL